MYSVFMRLYTVELGTKLLFVKREFPFNVVRHQWRSRQLEILPRIVRFN